MTATTAPWKDCDIARCRRPCNQPIMMWSDGVWRHEDNHTECPDAFDPNDPGHDWHAEPEPRSMRSEDIDLDEIEGCNIDSLASDALYNPDVWTLAADRNTLIDEVRKLRKQREMLRLAVEILRRDEEHWRQQSQVERTRLESALEEEHRIVGIALASIRVLRAGVQDALRSDSVGCDPEVETLLRRALEVSAQQGRQQ